MALKFPKFSAADAKSRVFLILAGVVGVGILIYMAVIFLGGGDSGAGPSRVANAPAGVQSVPGSKLSPVYSQALQQLNTQKAQEARMSGQSAVPTLMNIPGQQPSFGSSGNCTVLCSDDNVDVSTSINDLVRQGKLSQDDANSIMDLAKKNVSVEEYAANLARLVKEGKLTPEQARKLLEEYKKQHSNSLVNESAAAMDALIKSGGLSLPVANELLALQKSNVTPTDYAAELDRLVKEGKITPEMAAQLLAQYNQQKLREAGKQSNFALAQMAAAGEITADVAKRLADLQNKNISVEDYAAELDRLVKEGKLTPAAAAKLLEEYRKQKMNASVSSTMDKLVSQGGPSAELAKRLKDLQGNNASINDYAAELKRAVQSGVLSPDDAGKLLQDYRTALMPAVVQGPNVSSTLPSSAEFAKLQQQLASQQPVAAGPPVDNSAEFLAAQAQAAAEARAARDERIKTLEAAMSTQAQTLINVAWAPEAMVHVGGSSEGKDKNGGGGPFADGSKGPPGSSTTTTTTTKTRPIIKSGTILFAVLDTTVDSDYPDTPVLATIVQGPFKGAKLLGKLALVQGKDKVSLNFSSIDMEAWPTTKAVTAFAIDPDTARSVMASSADHHYLMRYGSIMGAAFLTGYASAITQAGSTQTTGVFGTTSTYPQLSPASKIAVGLGQVGTTIGTAIQSYINTPTTVKVNSGVGLGILFMADVKE